MFGRPKNTRVCPLCRGSKTETYYEDEGSWGARRRVQKTRTCTGCGGMGYVS